MSLTQAEIRNRMTEQDRKRIALHDLNRKARETIAHINYWHTKIDTCKPEYVQQYKEKFADGKQRVYNLLVKIEQVKNNPVSNVSPLVCDLELISDKQIEKE